MHSLHNAQRSAVAIDDYAIKTAWNALKRRVPELPDKFLLSPDHEAQLNCSGISPLQACVAGIFSATAKTAEALTGHSVSGLIFTYFDTAGSIYRWGKEGLPFFRIRPDSGTSKYLSPKGSPSFIYFPRTTTSHSWERLDGITLLITEGEKKALCATLHGIPCLGLGGVNSFRTGEECSEGHRHLGALVDEVNLLAAKKVITIFDSDIVHKPEVAAAIKSFSFAVCGAYREKERQTSGSVRPRKVLSLNQKLLYSLLPNLPRNKIGLDDAIARFGVNAVTELIENGLPLVKLSVDKNDKNEIEIKCLFAAEPLGDDAHKDTPHNRQRMVRSLIAWLTTKSDWASIPTLGYLQWDAAIGIWQPVTKEEWANLPEKIADLNNWRNRQPQLMSQMRQLISNRLCLSRDLFDSPGLLAFTNGVLILDTMRIEPCRADHYLTQRLGFEYDGNATCNTWLGWLSWTFNDDYETVKLVQALLRWTLEPKGNKAHEIEVWPILIGKPARGKGTFLEVLLGLVGDAAASWNLETIGNPNGIFSLVGRLASVCLELKGVISSKTSTALNQVISNEPMPIKPLYKDITYGRCNTVLWAASNEPLSSGTADRVGLDRRTVYLQFERKPSKKDPFLKQRLLHELPGIFNWVWQLPITDAISIIQAYQIGESNLAAQKEMLEESNTVYQWIIEKNIESTVTLKLFDCYIDYCNWCDENRIKHPLGKKTFSRELIKGGATKGRDSETRDTVLSIPSISELDVKGMLGL